MTGAEQLNNFFMWWSIAWIAVGVAALLHRGLLWVLDKISPEAPPPYLGAHLMNLRFYGVVTDDEKRPASGS